MFEDEGFVKVELSFQGQNKSSIGTCPPRPLSLPYGNFCKAEHLVVEQITRLHTIDDVVFLTFLFDRDEGDGFVEVGVKDGIVRVHLLQPLLFEHTQELLMHQLQTFTQRDHIFALRHVLLSAVHIVQNGKKTFDYFFSSIEDEVGLRGNAVLAEVGKVGGLTKHFIFKFCDFCLSLCQFVGI